MSRGILFIVSAPSGAGKTSLVRALRERDPSLGLAVSHTTRSPRPNEIDGTHYYFVSPDRFLEMVTQGRFLEHAEVFGNRYGTEESGVRAELEQGRDMLLEIDWQGARQVRARFPEAVSVFILPPSAQTLERRLRERGSDSDRVISQRMAEARSEMSHHNEYDYLIVNDLFEAALEELACVVKAERLRGARIRRRIDSLLGTRD